MDTQLFTDLNSARQRNFNTLRAALSIVHATIIEKQFIIYGGMSIDLALRQAGQSGLYNDFTIPDYDFLTPDCYTESIELADKLYAAGIKDVSAINAAHTTTRRVRVDFMVVADIGFIPKKLYDRVPTLTVGGIRIVHPWYQRLDQHRAFSRPFENPPQEVFSFRAKKDIKRFKLLAAAYPLPEPAAPKLTSGGKYTLPSGALTGIGAALYYTGEATFSNGVLTTPHIPECFVLSILNENSLTLIDSLVAASNNREITPVYFERLLDSIKQRGALLTAPTGKCKTEILDSRGTLISATVLDEKLDIWIAHPQAVLCYLLAEWIFSKNDAWLYYYNQLVAAVGAAEAEIAAGNITEANARMMINTSVYGTHNWDYTYFTTYCKQVATINSDTEMLNEVNSWRPPHGYYPDRQKPAKEFAQDSWIYTISGETIERYTEYNLPAISVK